MKAFKFFYQSTINSRIEYLYILAYTLKQACYFLTIHRRNVLGHVYDISYEPVEVIESKDFINYHEVGEVYGCNAIL